MAEDIALSLEESLSYFVKARARALISNSMIVLKHQIDLPTEYREGTIKAWVKAGWLEPTFSFTGALAYKLPEKHRAYMPNEPNVMSAEEQSELVALARANARGDGTVSVSKLPRQGLWRLVDAGIIINYRSGASHRYVLAEAHR